MGYKQVGKTSLLMSFLYNKFSSKFESDEYDTFRDKIETFKHSKTVNMDNCQIPITIFDMEPTVPVPKAAECVDKSRGIVLVFSTAERYSFDKLKYVTKLWFLFVGLIC